MITTTRITELLPEFWQDALAEPSSPAAGLVEVMEGMLAPTEHRIMSLDVMLDPHRCDARMLPFLTVMAGFGAILPYCSAGGAAPEITLRSLLIAAPELTAQRGQPRALVRALQIVTGQIPTIDETPQGSRGFHIVIRLPDAARSSLPLIDATVRLMRPAHVTHAIDFGDLSPQQALIPLPPQLPDHFDDDRKDR